MAEVRAAAEERAARRQAHWQARQARQVQQRGHAGLADAWWDRCRVICKAHPEAWQDLALTLENWAARQSR
ncbi:hypothetical protein ACH4FX_37175 [Streptomyces sp. NPDC018019]|uniref:hypothetical protein n=1 Tax=Streptomyces sp. NPDC018019 TaxID=3365030 RepID=UPI003791B7B7